MKTKLLSFKLLLLVALSFLSSTAFGQSTTYTFNSVSWGASPANWVSGKAGNQFQSGRGVQITTGATGAFAASPISFSNVTKVDVVYSTNAANGVGTIRLNSVASSSAAINTGTQIGSTFSIVKPSSGGDTDKVASFTASSPLTGFVQIAVTCTTNSIYIKSVEITYAAGKTVTFNKNAATATGTMANQTAAPNTNLTANAFNRSGYFFKEWNTTSTGSGTVYANQASYPFAADETLYAQWQQATITLSNNGAQVADANVVQGANDHLLSKFVINSANANTTLKELMLNGTGNYHSDDVTAFKLWRTSGATYTSPTLVKSIPTNSASGSGDVILFDAFNENIAKDANAYFWVTVSLSPTAVTGRTIGAGAINTSDAYLIFDETNNTFTGSASAGGLQTITANMAPHFLIENPANLNFGTVCINTTAPIPGTFDLYGFNLTGDATVGPFAGYSFSTDGTTFSPSLTLTPDGSGAILEEISVRFTPTAAQAYNGNVPVSEGGAPTVNVAVTGEGIAGTVAVTTVIANSITANAAVSGGDTLSTTCGTITAKGVVWDVATNPTIALSTKTNDGTGTADYVSNLTGLAADTKYFYRAYATNSNGITSYGTERSFTTSCSSVTLPYTEDFENVTVPALPSCTTVVNAGTGNVWKTAATPQDGGFTSKVLAYEYNTNNAANTWFFTKGLELTAGVTYRLKYEYGNNSASYTEKLKVAYGTSNTAVAMTNVLADYPNVNQEAVQSASNTFTPSTTGVYYIGFQAYSAKDQYHLYVDNINVDVAPSALYIKDAANADVTAVTFVDQAVQVGSASRTLYLSGNVLTGAPGQISITAPTHFQVSKDNLDWSASIDIDYTAATLASTPFYVRFNPQIGCTSLTGQLTIVGGGATEIPTVNLSGTGYVPAPVATPATSITGTSFVANWNAVPNATSYKVNVYKESGTTINTDVTATFANYGYTNAQTFPTGVIDGSFTFSTENNDSPTNPAYYDTGGIRVYGNTISGKGNTFTLNIPNNVTVTGVDIIKGTGSQASTYAYYVDGSTTAGGTGSFTSGTGTVSLSSLLATSRLIIQNTSTGSNSAVRISSIKIYYTANNVIKTPIAGSPFTVAAPATSANITGLEADTDYFYTVEALVDACASVASNEIAVSTADRVIWDGTAWNNVEGPNAQVNAEIAGFYDVTTDFVAKDLSVTTGSLAIQPGHSVTVHGALSQSADDLIIVESDASLLQVEGSTHDGKTITVKRHAHVPANQYNLWSSPVVAQDLYALYGAAGSVPAGKVMEYITKTDTFKPMDVGSKSASAKGYSALGLASNDVTAIFQGVPNNGVLTYEAGTNTGQGDGYNLIGNPYPSNFDLDKFYSLNKNALDGETVAEPGVNVGDNTAYFWDNTDNVSYGQYGSNYNGDNYAVYNFSSKTGIGAPAFNETGGGKVPTAIIKPGQGFIVKLKKATSSLNFDNTMRTSDTSPVYFKTEAPKRYWLELTTPKQLIISTAVVYNEAAVNTYDKYDTAANTFASDGFYTMTSNAKAVSIQGRQDVNIKDDVVPVGIKAYEAGDYSIRFAKGDNIFADGQDVYLKDNSLNKIVKLTDAGYHFALDKGVNTTRFEIVYQSKTLAVDAVNSQKEIVVYKDADSFVVKARSTAITKVEVYDMLGRLVLVSDKASKEVRIANASLVEGTYVLKISQNNNIVTQKVIK